MKLLFIIAAFLLTNAGAAQAQSGSSDTLLYADRRWYLVTIGDTAYFEIFVSHKYDYFYRHDTFWKTPAGIWAGNRSSLQSEGPGFTLTTQFDGYTKPRRQSLLPATPTQKALWLGRHLETERAARWMDSMNGMPGRFTGQNSHW